jgi:xanthine/CO dehydrogenase XdhC/CoxF family maturation factor
MERLFETIADLKKSGELFGLAIIIKVEGSTPRKVGDDYFEGREDCRYTGRW